MALTYYVKPKAKKVPTKKAERIIEKSVGANVLKKVGSKKKADIVVGQIPLTLKKKDFPSGYVTPVPTTHKEATTGKTKMKVRTYKGMNLESSAYGRKVKKGLVQTTAHEFGHAVGLWHKKGRKNNLMSYSNWGTSLTPQQKRRAKRISGTK